MTTTLSHLHFNYKTFNDKIDKIRQDLSTKGVQLVEIDVFNKAKIPVQEFIEKHEHYEKQLALID